MRGKIEEGKEGKKRGKGVKEGGKEAETASGVEFLDKKKCSRRIIKKFSFPKICNTIGFSFLQDPYREDLHCF